MRSVNQGSRRPGMPNIRVHSLTLSLLMGMGGVSLIAAPAYAFGFIEPAASMDTTLVESSQNPAGPQRLLRAGLSGDSDGDGIPDIVDIDDDNDTITDDIEGTGDTDGDGIIDCLDLDSDNDGIPDLIEAVSSNLLAIIDSDRDGILDDSVDVGDNGLADIAETSPESGMSEAGNFDLDGDGIRDQHDLDSDNDGIPDIVEAGSSDSDFDGLYDFFRDLDGNGLGDRLMTFPIAIRDTDSDGAFDFRDVDSDGDGLTDRFEISFEDVDGDGQVDSFIDLNIDGLNDAYVTDRQPLPDTDSDGFPDYLDTDSDGDGVSDAEEAFTGTQGMVPPMSTVPFTPATEELASDEIVLVTGENGSVLGCSVVSSSSSSTKQDPILLLLLAASSLLFFRRYLVSVQAAITRKKKSLLGVGLASLVITGCASITGPKSSNTPYVGLGLGASFLNADTAGLGIDQEDDIGTAAQVTLGLDVTGPLAFELRAADLGEATFNTGQAVGYQVADTSVLVEKSFSRFSAFGRMGVGMLFNDGDIETTQRNDVHFLVGAGAEYDLTPRFALRGEWQGHDTDVMHTQLSVLYRFGRPSTNPPVLIVDSGQSAPKLEIDATEVEVPKPSVPKPNVVTTVPTIEPIDRNESELLTIEPKPTPRELASSSQERLKPLVTVPVAPAPETVEPEPIEPIAELVMPEALETPEVPEVPEVPEAIPSAPVVQETDTNLDDVDQDGIKDAFDNCPDTNVGVPILADGCAMFGDSVSGLSFFPDTDRLTSTAEVVLDQVADTLADDSDIRVTVAAHTGSSSDANAAMFLTRRRTLSIIRYLSDKGIETTRLRPEAFGDTQPLAGAIEPSDNDRVVLTLR